MNYMEKILWAVIFFAQALFATTYTVGVNEDFDSVSSAIAVAQPGDTILVREKNEPYCERIKFIRGGNEQEGFIVLKAYPGEHPVLDLTDFDFGSEWRIGAVEITDVSYIEVNGFEIRNLITNDPDKFPAGIWIRGNSNHINILNNTIHDIKHLNSAAGAHGIAVYGDNPDYSVHEITVKNNEIYNCKLAWSETLALNGNVESFTISENIIHDNDNIAFDFIGFENVCPDEQKDYVRNGLVIHNVAYNIDSRNNPSYNGEGAAAGFYVDGGSDIIFDGNLAYNCNLGFELASEHYGKATNAITLRNNFATGNYAAGISIGGYDAQRGKTTNAKIINNTLYKNGTEEDWGAEFFIQYYCENITFKNNIVFAGNNVPVIAKENATGSDFFFDKNIFYAEGTPTWAWNGEYFYAFDDYRQNANLDSNSLFADPAFTEEIRNYKPEISASSVAVDFGEDFSADIVGEYDFCGNPRFYGAALDAGAFEVNNGVGIRDEEFPSDFVLYQNYPNPFNPITIIKYTIPDVETLHATSLRIYNILGREIATLVNQKQLPGNYSVTFDASNLPSGVYFYTLRAGEFSATKKMILLK